MNADTNSDARPFRHLSSRKLRKAYRQAFHQWEFCVERYYESLAPAHLAAMKKIAAELDARIVLPAYTTGIEV